MKKYHKSIVGSFFKLLLTGIATFMPLGVTLWLGWWVIKTSDILFNKLVPDSLNPNSYLNMYIPGAGIVFTILFFVILGLISRIFVGRWLFGLMDGIMIRLPIMKTIYNSLKTLTRTFLGDANKTFGEPCLIQFPCANEWSIGFLTGSSISQIQKKITEKNTSMQDTAYEIFPSFDDSDDSADSASSTLLHKKQNLVNVYVPTTPNPTSGYLLFIPKNDIIILDMTADEALKLVISGGIVAPEDNIKNHKANP